MDYCRIFQLRVADHAIEFSVCAKDQMLSVRLVDYDRAGVTIASETATFKELESIIGELQDFLNEAH